MTKGFATKLTRQTRPTDPNPISHERIGDLKSKSLKNRDEEEYPSNYQE